MLTTFDDDALFLEAMRAGANGFLLKDVSLERLASAIRVVSTGKTMLQPGMRERIIRIVRESDVLRLAAAGSSNREIGEALKVSEGAVKNHLSMVLQKLGARDKVRVALRAIELGLV